MISSRLPSPVSQLLSWHGWSLALPDEWAPVKIDGTFDKGSVTVADLHASRLAVRWQTIKRRRFDADAWARGAVLAEVGQLMLEQSTARLPDDAEGWQGGRLFVEPEPPGRDVWVGYHAPSGRALEIVHPSTKRSRTLAEIVASLRFTATEWSVLDLSCRVPDGWSLRRQRLNAGDLTLTFGRGREVLVVRQLGPATLALARQPIERWVGSHAKLWEKTYADRTPARTTETEDEVARTYDRRRRFFFARWLAPRREIVASHDRERDRLVIVDAPNDALARRVLATVGRPPGEPRTPMSASGACASLTAHQATPN